MFIDDLSSGSMPDLYTAVGGECGAVDLQHFLLTFLNFASLQVAEDKF
jgi:hypothetical protein